MRLPLFFPSDFSFYGLKLTLAGEAVAVALGIYLLLVAVGRVLKRRFHVRLGQVYQLFCAAMGPYLAVTALAPVLPGRTELGAVSAFLGTGVLIRLIDQLLLALVFRGKTPGARSEVHP